jgi:hypothetical protein
MIASELREEAKKNLHEYGPACVVIPSEEHLQALWWWVKGVIRYVEVERFAKKGVIC